MKIGFAKNDITPRVGVELCGFGPFICRHSVGIRDRLWVRAMAVENDGKKALAISCDLIGTALDITKKARLKIAESTGLSEDEILICSTHTHSGPNTGPYIGWGAPDEPYRETLHMRIAKAGIEAVNNMREAVLCHAEVPCEGIGQNREYDKDALPLEQVLNENWRPSKPELTDTTCHVITARTSDGKLIGFASYFGCHPVVCCAATRYIHGDYCGIATNQIERDYDNVVGLFFQGAQGDVNSCVVHKPEQESLLALDIIAGRYARAVRRGIAEAVPIKVDTIRTIRKEVIFSRKKWGLDKLRQMLGEKEAKLSLSDVTDDYSTADWRIRMEMVYIIALRGLVEKAERGESLEPPTEIHGLRVGPLSLLGSPFETFQAIKNDVKKLAKSKIPLVVSFVNDSVGYAPDKTAAARGGYATDMVPLICGQLPFANIHEELVRHLLELDADLNA